MKLVQFVLPSGGSSLVRSGNPPGIVIRASACVVIGLSCLFPAFQACSADCVSPPAGLVSWWSGEGTANDIAGTNSGTLVNGVAFAPGKVGQAFSFDGTSSYIRVPDNPSLHCTNAMTIEAWIYPTSLGAYHNIVSKWDWAVTNAQISYATLVMPNGQIGFGVCNNGYCPQGATNVFSTNSVSVNQWTHFAATYDGSNIKMYVNGVCENQTVYNSGIFPGTNDLLIGVGAVGGGQFILRLRG